MFPLITRSLSTKAKLAKDKTVEGEYVFVIVTVLSEVASLSVTALILAICAAPPEKSVSSTLTITVPFTITLGSSASVLINDSTYSKVATLLIVIF